MADKIQVRRDTAANWASVNPVLSQGEMGLTTDTSVLKFGNGSTAWNSLAEFSSGGGGGGGAVDSVFGRTGVVVATSGDYTTAQVTESGNLYFTNARAIGATLNGYSAGAGTITSSDTVLQAIQKLAGNAATPVAERVVALTDAATVTPNASTTDIGTLATLSQTTTFANPTGSPVNGQKLTLRIKSSTARTISFGTKYRGSADLALASLTSGSNLTDYMAFRYNAADDKWDYIAKNFGF